MFNSIMNMPWILNMPGFQICKVYTWFWIKFSMIDIWKGSEYTSSSDCASITQSSVPRVISMLRFEYKQRMWICQGFTRFCVNCILKIKGILNALSFEYAKIVNVSGVQICYRYKVFWIKYFIVFEWLH